MGNHNKDLVRSLLEKRLTQGSKHQLSYEIISSKLAEIRFEKCKKYGESRYEPQDAEFNLWMCFSDVHRKYIRLSKLTKLAVRGDKEAKKLLIDAYFDLANYAIMGVQILEAMED